MRALADLRSLAAVAALGGRFLDEEIEAVAPATVI